MWVDPMGNVVVSGGALFALSVWAVEAVLNIPTIATTVSQFPEAVAATLRAAKNAIDKYGSEASNYIDEISQEVQRRVSGSGGDGGGWDGDTPFQNLMKKFQQHVVGRKEFGDITPGEYYNRANNLYKSEVGDNILGFTTKEGGIFKFNKLTGEFLYGTETGGITTFYKPTDGIDYWFRQVTEWCEK
ncbi:MAG: hypothetical protein CVV64_22825 [Candidatus Wallbacteria bacterium HGW-Wallbacteria-1]|uniref:Pre-toxin TG domain-containing protein n=1 Tax=Candidatus Wallbacteria bacterium HGW-Wallbacteria-1 TaxID=2013854 RepID=A0A2N1PFB0_9BACT|nr:MAG: hypothetical protein CVV64_22825 [Candidatus Wallbacteria bacterium HGW-Wallbacteria-1]